jgi:predicted O-methyltransferase YrrM
MRGITEKKTEQYIYSLLPRRDAVLREMERYAARHDVPIIGPACGRLLYQLTRLINARRVFELGSAIGYSTIWLARAVGPEGTVYYTDNDPANAHRAEANLRRAGVSDRVEIMVGDALDSFRSTQGEFDLIFNDVDKRQYPAVFDLVLARLRVGGLFITDNVLRDGRTARPAPRTDTATRAIQRFNRMIYRSPQLLTTIVPLRDGFGICLKVSDK